MTKPILTKWWLKIAVSLITAALFVLLVCTVFPVKQIEHNDSLSHFTEHLDRRIPTLIEAYDIPGVSLAIVDEGKVVWTKAYGYADVKAGKKMSSNDYMRVESISKSVTAWGVMKLEEQGKIDLYTPISHYLSSWELPESPYNEEQITIKQLLSHTSGMYIGDFLARYNPKEKRPTLEETLTKEAILINEPGMKFSYSNVGYNLLELMIEQVTKMDFAEYMSSEVLLPLGMKNSSYDWNKEFSQMPKGYNLKGEVIEPYVYSYKASGGLTATVEDIGLFVSSQMQEYNSSIEVLNNQSITEIRTSTVDKLGLYSLVFDTYGYGCYIENLPDGKKAIAHGGQGAGWMTHYHAVPQTGDGIVILTNSQRSWPFISYMLCDWSKWCGLPSLGMERIYVGIIASWVFMGLVWFICLIQLWRIIEGYVVKTRRFTLSARWSVLRIVKIILAAVICIALLWCMGQDYLFVSSVLPIVSGWLCVSGFIIAGVLILSALFPKQSNRI